MVLDMNFTRDSPGKNMGSSRERHEKLMGKTWGSGGRFIPNSYISKPRPELRTGCTRIAQQLRSNCEAFPGEEHTISSYYRFTPLLNNPV